MSARLRGLDLVRALVMLLVVGAVGWALVRNWSQVRGYLGTMSWGMLAAGTALTVASAGLTVLGWRVLLADLGSSLSPPQASSVFFVGQLGKYVPGSVWSVVVQSELAAKLGVPRARTAVVGFLTIGLALLVALALGLPALPLLLSGGRQPPSLWWLLLAALALAVAMWPGLLNALIRSGLRLLRRPALEHELTRPAIVLSLGWFLGAWLAGGLAVWVVARPFMRSDVLLAETLVVVLCGTALASAIGMASFLFPAGVGVREGLLVVALSSMMPLPAAAAVAVVARFLAVIADLSCAVGGYSWAALHHLLPGRRTRDGQLPSR